MLQPIEFNDYHNIIGGQDIEFEGHATFKVKIGGEKAPIHAETGGTVRVKGATTGKEVKNVVRKGLASSAQAKNHIASQQRRP